GVATALQDAITAVEGFEGVTVTVDGADLVVTDPEGRGISGVSFDGGDVEAVASVTTLSDVDVAEAGDLTSVTLTIGTEEFSEVVTSAATDLSGVATAL